MVKPRLHVSIPDHVYNYAINESTKFNDSISAFITYCIYLYASVNSSTSFENKSINPNKIELTNNNNVLKTSTVLSEENKEIPEPLAEQPTINDNYDNELVDSIHNILTMKG